MAIRVLKHFISRGESELG